jgi:tetratricopeptide (TPR) repeat protein
MAFDVLKLVDEEEPLKCRVDGLGDTFIVARVAIEIGGPAGAGGKTRTEQRTIQLADIEFIDFEMPEAEASLLESPTAGKLEQLRDLWESKSKWLGIRRSNSGAAGLAVADVLLQSGEAAKVSVALATYAAVERGDWDTGRQALAQQGKLRCLLVLGRPEEALEEAKRVAETAEDPGILVETRLVMAQAARDQFEALLEENPKWREDDEVREQVMEHYHATVDQFLYPCLFHGSLEEPAARGLWNAVEVYLLGEDREAAQNSANDLLKLYPASEYAEKARLLVKAPTVEVVPGN